MLAWVWLKRHIPPPLAVAARAAQTNFTSVATPSQVGSGRTALVTLLHEGGHAAHFANVLQHSPFFSQERAPTSVAYAENQSMVRDRCRCYGLAGPLGQTSRRC